MIEWLNHVHEFDWVTAFYGLLWSKLDKTGIVLVCNDLESVVLVFKLQVWVLGCEFGMGCVLVCA